MAFADVADFAFWSRIARTSGGTFVFKVGAISCTSLTIPG